MPRAFAGLENIRLRYVLASLIALMVSASNATDGGDQVTSDQMRADCRAEGEAGGLEGAELEDFIRDCVTDLLSVEITNIEGQ